MDKKVSVLMSTYKNDNPEYLKIAIDSILNQSKKAEQIVIVVDGNIPDVNTEILNNYNKEFPSIFKIIKLENNVGLGLALRRGVEECDYDLIMRMDSDDISRYDRLEKQCNCIIDNNYDVVGSNISEFIDTEDNIVSVRKVPENDNEIKEYLKTRCPMNHVSVMFKKDSILAVGNYESLLYNEDYLLWIKLYNNNCSFYNIQENLVNVRIGKEMFSRRGGYKYFSSEYKIQKIMLKDKIISFFTFCTNVFKRFTLQILMTNKMRQFVYKRFARS